MAPNGGEKRVLDRVSRAPRANLCRPSFTLHGLDGLRLRPFILWLFINGTKARKVNVWRSERRTRAFCFRLKGSSVHQIEVCILQQYNISTCTCFQFSPMSSELRPSFPHKVHFHSHAVSPLPYYDLPLKATVRRPLNIKRGKRSPTRSKFTLETRESRALMRV